MNWSSMMGQGGGGILEEMNINGIAQCNESSLENVNSTEHNRYVGFLS